MNATFAVLGMSGGELILVLGAILILFGAKRIPEFAKGLGQGMREFKKASSEVTQEFNNAMEAEEYKRNHPPTPPEPPAPTTTEAATTAQSTSPSPNLSHNQPPQTVPKT